MTDNNIQLVKLIVEFSRNTILGQESGVYKSISNSSIPLPLSALKTNNIAALYSKSITVYLNKCYRSLILDDDRYITDQFNKMSDLMNHSKICLLNIIAKCIQFLFAMIDRQKLDISSYDNYMSSLSSQMILNRESFEMFVGAVNHGCQGKDIKTCDPDTDMFV